MKWCRAQCHYLAVAALRHAHCMVVAATLFAHPRPREHRTQLRVCTRWGSAQRSNLQLQCLITTVMSPLPCHTPYAARQPNN